MKQIKTITAKVKNAKKFDKEVNDAVAKGWDLHSRQLMPDPPLLYAELSIDDYLPEGAGCSNCSDYPRKESLHSRCHGCRDGSRWRPKP